jgi:hypothetical protein
MSSPSGQPSIELFGLQIMEPVVTLTDFLITGVCVYAFVQLSKKNLTGRAHGYMRWYFLLMALATFFGGLLGHALQAQLGVIWKLPGWIMSMLAISVLQLGTARYASSLLTNRFTHYVNIANIIELTILGTITVGSLNFMYVQLHSAYGLGLIVLPLHFYLFKKTQNKGSRIMCLSTVFSALAAMVYSLKFAPSVWFNHLDMAHTIMAISLFLFYRATVHLPTVEQTQKGQHISYKKALHLLFKRKPSRDLVFK